MNAHRNIAVPSVTDAPRGLIDRMGRDNMAKWDRREEDYARRHGIIAEDDNYAWRIIWIDRLTGAYGSAEGLPYRTRVEAIEAMHAKPMTERFIAQGVVRERTHFETRESDFPEAGDPEPDWHPVSMATPNSGDTQ